MKLYGSDIKKTVTTTTSLSRQGQNIYRIRHLANFSSPVRDGIGMNCLMFLTPLRFNGLVQPINEFRTKSITAESRRDLRRGPQRLKIVKVIRSDLFGRG